MMRLVLAASVAVLAAFLAQPCSAQMKSRVSLNGIWKLTNQNRSITVNGSVPGNVYSDLMHAGILGDPYYRFNDLDYRWVSYDNWTYSRSFEVSSEMLTHSKIKLLCGGLDTVATVWINSRVVGISNNMFIRYVFDIKDDLQIGTNTIGVSFTSAVTYSAQQAKSYPYVVPPECPPPVQKGECHANFIRKEAASFSWDWGPAFPTQGIWRNISLDVYNTASIRYILPEIYNTDGTSQWQLKLRVIFDVSSMQAGAVSVSIPELGISTSDKVMLSEAADVYATTITIKNPVLWWPNGYGEQKLYDVMITFNSGSDMSKAKIRIGFRTVELVQQPVKDSSGLSFYFRINGMPIFMMGSNWIPADSFQDRITTEYLRRLLVSAADANMNMLRVWGGGIYEKEALYELADELGIMIWQDFMFACALYPSNKDFLSNVADEVTHQVRRLMRHPSIAIWAGNNENEGALREGWYVHNNYTLYYHDYVKLYVDTIRSIVMKEDPSRPFVSSSPSNGIETEKEGWVAKNPQDPHYGDVHHYDYDSNSWDYTVYPVTRFTSEYGIQSWCSFESVAKVSIKGDWSMDSDFANHRQHHGNGNKELKDEVQKNLNPPTSTDPIENFKHWIYLTQINQAMGIKTESELLRRSQSEIDPATGEGGTMGALYWQLNDIWQAPTWASTEYGSGKWKMLHYYAKHFFNTTLLSAYVDGNTVKVSLAYNGPARPQFRQVDADSRMSVNQILNIDCYSWQSLMPLKSFRQEFSVQDIAAYTIFSADVTSMLKAAGCAGPEHCFFYMYLNNDMSGPHSTLLLSNFIQAQGLQKPSLKVKSVTKVSDRTFSVSLQTSAVTPFVWLEVKGVLGRFSDNGFMMVHTSHQVEFYAWQDVTQTEVITNLSVMSLMDVYQ